MSFIPGCILAKRAASPTVTLLDLSIPSLTFAPGQWLDFCIPTADWIGGFSIASGPAADETIQIAVKESTHPPAHWVTHDSQVGDTVIVKVGGTCLLHSEQHAHPAIMIAGGIGISPVLGLYRQHVIEKRPPVKLYYSVSTEEEVVFRNELEQLIRPNDHLTITLTQSNTWNQQQSPPNNIDYQVGRTMTAFLNDTLLPDNAIYYVCGPPSMQDEALETLRSHDVAPDRLVYEKWW